MHKAGLHRPMLVSMRFPVQNCQDFQSFLVTLPVGDFGYKACVHAFPCAEVSGFSKLSCDTAGG